MQHTYFIKKFEKYLILFNINIIYKLENWNTQRHEH